MDYLRYFLRVMECQQYFWKTNEINWVNQSQKVLPLSCSKLPAPGCIRYKFYKKLWKYRNPQASHCPQREKWSKIEKLSVNINGFLPREPSDYWEEMQESSSTGASRLAGLTPAPWEQKDLSFCASLKEMTAEGESQHINPLRSQSHLHITEIHHLI